MLGSLADNAVNKQAADFTRKHRAYSALMTNHPRYAVKLGWFFGRIRAFVQTRATCALQESPIS
jgi:hypothetical protein